MKVKVIIEEVISQEFEIEVNPDENVYTQVREKYMDGILQLTDPQITEASACIIDEHGIECDWLNLHV